MAAQERRGDVVRDMYSIWWWPMYVRPGCPALLLAHEATRTTSQRNKGPYSPNSKEPKQTSRPTSRHTARNGGSLGGALPALGDPIRDVHRGSLHLCQLAEVVDQQLELLQLKSGIPIAIKLFHDVVYLLW